MLLLSIQFTPLAGGKVGRENQESGRRSRSGSTSHGATLLPFTDTKKSGPARCGRT